MGHCYRETDMTTTLDEHISIPLERTVWVPLYVEKVLGALIIFLYCQASDNHSQYQLASPTVNALTRHPSIL